ncbi:hypothetical protein CEUSTIGMA_g2056.t1 [Chlamydomonas eustigma]|uniref:Tf2-1-like SH3-like domain-containing protein n=1 Tax=Chlamydomonas eustigma TaxID=1157962 RepID=A0A250WUV8_9CHLO|nr:hypothetical protein CEUSTIGMA_g2056.t1 [Chlamydomonas eustigma]|eukprot:GAX74608.1 hypothetical protein CEUSTIGMA_g2056.t1 [Chlamydomonas eustigma]
MPSLISSKNKYWNPDYDQAMVSYCMPFEEQEKLKNRMGSRADVVVAVRTSEIDVQAMETVMGSNATSFLDNLRDVQNSIRHQLDLAKARQETHVNRSRRPLTFTVGDRVRLSSDHLTLVEYPSSKLRPRFLGPFTINQVISPVAYRLTLPAALSHIHPVFHVSCLLPWNDNPTSEFPQRDTPSQPLANPRDYVRNVHPVHSILDCRIQTDPDSRARPKSKCLFFKVRWSTTPNPDQPIDTWEPMRSLTKLTTFKDFLSSPTWSTFVQTPAYLSFARLYKTKIPKVVHFAVLDDAT